MPHSSASPRLLIFVEDPGAANFVVPLLESFAAFNVTYRLLAQGNACRYLINRRVTFEAIPDRADASALLQAWQPDLIAIGTAENRDTWAWQLLEAARRAKVATVGLVDSAVNATHRFRGNTDRPLQFVPDALVVPDDATREAFIALGVDPKCMETCGHPNHDRIYAMAGAMKHDSEQTRVPRPGDEIRIVFLSELSDAVGGGVYSRDELYTLTGQGASDLRTHVVLDEFLQACEQVLPAARRVLRLHPKQAPSDLEIYLEQFHEVSSGGDPIDCVRRADLVVGMTTALLDEAALLGKPTLALVPRELEKNWNASVQWGATVAVWKRQDLLGQLQHFRSNGCLQHTSKRQLPPQGAVQRVTKALLGLATRNNHAAAFSPDQGRKGPREVRATTASSRLMSEITSPDWTRRRQAC